jgi:hypothetical protein
MVPTDGSVELWILSVSAPQAIPYASRCFELHKDVMRPNSESFRDSDSPEEARKIYRKLLKSVPCPLYMVKRHKEFPMSRPFPFKDMVMKFGTYFDNSISWIVAMAIDELMPFKGEKEIQFYGVDFNEERHLFQRGNCEYFIGLAIGLGIKINIAHGSSLLKTCDGLLYGLRKKPEDVVPEWAEEIRKEKQRDLEVQAAAMESQQQTIKEMAQATA